jgi:branched-chain amino acid transport system ATP-binding protein
MILEAKGIVKTFGGLVALNRLDIDVEKGEILGLIGPNGSGKTTFFNIVSGIYRPDRGKIIYNGEEITHLPPYARARRGIGRTFQIVRPFPSLTVRENIMIGGFFSTERARDGGFIEYILELTGLAAKSDLPAKALNLPERRRLEIARALALKPKLLLLDETLAGLTPVEIDQALHMIDRIRREMDVTIIMVEHIMKAVMKISDRVVVLSNGMKIAEGTPSEVANNPAVIEAYLGRVM